MDAYNETHSTLQEMESRYHDGFSSTDRAYLDNLYYDLFGREISNKGCSDCYRDAYMEIKIKLRKEKAMPKKCDYKLKPGAIIVFFGESQAYSNPNLTNEVAERYLSKNANHSVMFAELPDDWKMRVNAYIEKTHTPGAVPVVDNLPDALTMIADRDEQLKKAQEVLNSKDKELGEILANKDKEIADLKGTISSLETALENAPSAAVAVEYETEAENLRLELTSANETIEADKVQIEQLSAQVDSLNTEVENLKKENKGLKQSNAMLKKGKENPEE